MNHIWVFILPKVIQFLYPDFMNMKTLNCILLILTCLNCYAEDQKLHIIQKSGNHISIPTTEKTKILFEDGVMRVGTEDFLVSNVSKYLIGTDEMLGINGVKEDNLHIDANDAVNGKVSIDNYSGQSIKMHSSNGMEVPCNVSVISNHAVVDYSSLPAGVYILSIGKETIKIQKR